jgi:hypothetical protein
MCAELLKRIEFLTVNRTKGNIAEETFQNLYPQECFFKDSLLWLYLLLTCINKKDQGEHMVVNGRTARIGGRHRLCVYFSGHSSIMFEVGGGST